GGTTSTLENTPGRLRASKSKHPVNQQQWMVELTKDNGNLRQELDCYKKKHQAAVDLHQKAIEAVSIPEEALETFSQREAESEKPLLSYWKIDL
ncbi:MAG: hypothetical protein Q9214_007740, partial [Letrouitia sp. 1 TL-2023]